MNNSKHMKARLKKIRISLIKWYQKSGRYFPWREKSDPYSILIAELLLRRTTATAVNRMYEPFLKIFDSIEILAKSDEQNIASTISTIGLQNTRARSLMAMAISIVKEHQGVIPKNKNLLEKLPGVGPYIAAATANFAFGASEPLVDGNVIHLLSRLLDLQYSGSDDPDAWEFMRLFGGRNQIKEFYWGMIDLVAMICIRQSPRCEICPLTKWCNYFENKIKSI